MFLEAVGNLGKETEGAFIVITGICVLLLVVITALMLWFVVRYRSSRSARAEQIHGNAPLEVAWTFGGVVLVLFLFYVGLEGYKLRASVPEDAMTVEVTARQWSWLFTYPGGKESDELHVPVDRPVRLVMESPDVIHSLYVPAFSVKQDVVPGSTKEMWFTPDQTGEYELFCTEYCGTGHYRMLSTVRVVPEDEFTAWVKPAAAEEKPSGEDLYRTKGCNACHTTDGSQSVGPTWKGLYGKKVTVITDGKKRTVTADEEYLRRSEHEPSADVVEGFPDAMPKFDLTEEEVDALVEYIKSLK